MRSCIVAQGTQAGALWWPGGVRWRRGGRLKKEGCVYNYGWFSLLYGRNQNNIVNIFKKLKCKEKKYSDNKIELPSEIYFKNTYLGISLLWKGTDLYYFSWKPLFRAHGISWIEKVFLNFCCWLLLPWLFWIIKKGSKTIWPQSLLLFMYIRVPLLCFLVPGTEKRDYPFNFLRGFFSLGLSVKEAKWNFCYWRRIHVLSHILRVACGNGVSEPKAIRTRRL